MSGNATPKPIVHRPVLATTTPRPALHSVPAEPATEVEQGKRLRALVGSEAGSNPAHLTLHAPPEVVAEALTRKLKSHPFPVTQTALGELIVKAASGEAMHLQIFQKWGRDPEAGPFGKIALQHWNQVTPLALAENRMIFAQRAYALVHQIYEETLTRFLEGQIKDDKEFGAQLSSLLWAINLFIDCIDAHRTIITPHWNDNEQANMMMHDEVKARMASLRLAAQRVERNGQLKFSDSILLARGAGGERRALYTIVHGAILKNALGLAAQHIHITVDIPQRLLLPTDKEDQRENLLANVSELIHNVIKYSDPNKPEKRLFIYWDAGRNALVVKDNGIGIRDTQTIWKRKTREVPVAAVVPGDGDGLYYVRKRSEEMGWRITVESTPGEGTKFFLHPPAGGVVTEER